MAGRVDPMREEEMRIEEAEGPWVDLVPTDVLHLVALHLPPPDLSSFKKVCKQWRSLLMESYPLGRSPLFLFNRCSSLLQCAKDFSDDDKLYLYSPLYNMTFSWAASREVLDICRSPESRIRYSKDGWLVFFKFDEPTHPAIVFVNPFLPSTTAPAVIKWRMPANCSITSLVSMSAPPTDPACIFLLMNAQYDLHWCYGIEIITGSEGGTNWKVDFFNIRGGIQNMCNTNPVFHGGRFYCLMTPRALGIYNPHQSTWDEHYFCLGIPVNQYNILVESNGELLIVSQFRDISFRFLVRPHVHKLNEPSMEWEELRELRGRSLFLDWRSATSAVAEVDGMKDTIFYDEFQDITVKLDCELHRSAGSDLRLVPRPHVGLINLTVVKLDCELHWSAGGDLRLIPRPHVGLPKLAGMAEGKLVGMSLPYSLDAAGKLGKEETCMNLSGCWLQPNWGQ